MAEYFIFFTDEWVADAGDEGWRQGSRDALGRIPTPDAERVAGTPKEA